MQTSQVGSQIRLALRSGHSPNHVFYQTSHRRYTKLLLVPPTYHNDSFFLSLRHPPVLSRLCFGASADMPLPQKTYSLTAQHHPQILLDPQSYLAIAHISVAHAPWACLVSSILCWTVSSARTGCKLLWFTVVSSGPGNW